MPEPADAHDSTASTRQAPATPGTGVAGTAGAAPSSQQSVPADLEHLRSSIDNIDSALIHILAERFKCTQAVGRLKAELGMPAADPQREAQQVARLKRLARDAGLDPVFAEKFLAFVIDEVIHHHEAIARAAQGNPPVLR